MMILLTLGSCAERKEQEQSKVSKEVKETRYVGDVTPKSISIASVIPKIHVDFKVVERTTTEEQLEMKETTKQTVDTEAIAAAVVTAITAVVNPPQAPGAIARMFSTPSNSEDSDLVGYAITALTSALLGGGAMHAANRRKKPLEKRANAD